MKRLNPTMHYPKMVISAVAGIATGISGGWQQDPGLRDCVVIQSNVPFLPVMPAEAGIGVGEWHD